MLKLTDIVKEYTMGEEKVVALKGLSLQFRESEFVSILGPSGCGKTTMLNIIGGLDRYTSGDLIINGKSTKDFNDKDWDSYRNHSVGFVFQNYNLIPHQTVIANVELALTLAGISKAESRRRATEALEKVGLGNQLYKKPNQMSGGQMQRVAIARAIVNNPDILLADEPTGALDTETSVQIMDILHEIAKDKLVIMVTHNPELAEGYSTRIVKLLDGELIDDSNPYDADSESAPEKTPESIAEDEALKPSQTDGMKASRKNRKTSNDMIKTQMSFKTAFSLSLNNLLTKKMRTFLVSFAGSIGIIGIALILSLSNGINNYINRVQEETLSTYPLTIEASTVDMTNMMTAFMGVTDDEEHEEHPDDGVYSSSILSDMANIFNSEIVTTNDLASFKAYLDSDECDMEKYATVRYGYDLNTDYYLSNGEKIDVMGLMTKAISGSTGSMIDLGSLMSMYSSYSSMISTANIFAEMLDNQTLLEQQYDLVGEGSRWPTSYDEVVLVVDSNNEMNDLMMFALGFKPMEEFEKQILQMHSGKEVESSSVKLEYSDILSRRFKVILKSEYYAYDDGTGLWVDKSGDENYIKTELLSDPSKYIELKIVGIVRPAKGSISTSISGALGYTHALTERVVGMTTEASVVKAQIASPKVDVLNGKEFYDGQSILKDINITEDLMNYFYESEYLPATYKAMFDAVLSGEMGGFSLTMKDLAGYLNNDSMTAIINMYMKQNFGYTIDQMFIEIFNDIRSGLTDDEFEDICYELEEDYDVDVETVLSKINFSPSSLGANLSAFGVSDINSPSTISIYARTFADKEKAEGIIAAYNAKVAAEIPDDDAHSAERNHKTIKYTDMVGLLMSSVTTIVDIISYILIAFVSISLIVSSIMIGIITYISVLERTKEIGILRAIGASKRDVSNVFNAETVIIGLAAGVIGIVVTLILNLIISLILQTLTHIPNMASLPWLGGLALIVISTILTLIAGLIPSGMAAKKDPVEALRSE